MRSAPRGASWRLRRRPWTEVGFASLDFETTGLNPRHDAIVSFGIVPITGGRVVVGRGIYREVSPTAPLTASSVVVHGIRPQDVAGQPPLADRKGDLAGALEGCVPLAWAAEIEAAFLANTFGRRPSAWFRSIVDVRRLAILVDRSEGQDRGRRAYPLTATASRLGVPVERPHHAFDDALTTAQVFVTLMPRLEAMGLRTASSLLRASRRRA